MGESTAMKLLAFIAFVVAMAVAEQNSMPLFTWKSGEAPTDSPASVDSALTSALSGSPEIVMVYMLHETSAQQMMDAKDTLTHLKDAVTSSQWSNYKSLPLAKSEISELLQSASSMEVNSVEVDSKDLQAFFAKHPDVLSNSKPDVVVVRFPAKESMASVDAVVGAAEKAVQAVTDDHCSILSTTSSMKTDDSTNLMTFYQSSDLWLRYPTIAQSNAGAVAGKRTFLKYGPTYYLTPTLLLAILVMIYSGIVALCAFCCILSLQTPQKFENDYKNEMDEALKNNEK